MRHGDDSVMEVSRTWSVAPGAVHRIYLGRTVTPTEVSKSKRYYPHHLVLCDANLNRKYTHF